MGQNYRQKVLVYSAATLVIALALGACDKKSNLTASGGVSSEAALTVKGAPR